MGFGTHTGTQDSRVLDEVPWHFLLSEGKKVSDVGQVAPGGGVWRCPRSGHSAQPGAWISRLCGSHAGAQAPQGGEGSEGPPCPLISSQESAQAQVQGWRQRGWGLGEGHGGGMWKAGRGNSRGQQGCQEVLWASH